MPNDPLNTNEVKPDNKALNDALNEEPASTTKPEVDLAHTHAGAVVEPAPEIANTSEVSETPEIVPPSITPSAASAAELDTPPSRKLVWIPIVGIVMVLLLAGGGGFWWYQNSRNASVTSEPTTNEPAPVIPEPVLEAPTGTITELDTEDTTPAINGTVSDPGATVSVSVNGNTYTAEVEEDGTWQVTVATALDAGSYNLSATFANAQDNSVTSSASAQLVITEPEPVAPIEPPVSQTPTTGPSLPSTGPRN